MCYLFYVSGLIHYQRYIAFCPRVVGVLPQVWGKTATNMGQSAHLSP